MPEMSSRERVRLALTCQRPDSIPVSLGFFSQSLPGIPDADEHFNLDVRYAEFSPPAGQDDFLRYLRRLPKDVHVGTTAQMRTYHEWDYHPEVAGGRLSGASSVAELAEAYFPDLTSPQRYAGLAEQVQRWHAQGLAVAGSRLSDETWAEVFDVQNRRPARHFIAVPALLRPAGLGGTHIKRHYRSLRSATPPDHKN